VIPQLPSRLTRRKILHTDQRPHLLRHVTILAPQQKFLPASFGILPHFSVFLPFITFLGYTSATFCLTKEQIMFSKLRIRQVFSQKRRSAPSPCPYAVLYALSCTFVHPRPAHLEDYLCGNILIRYGNTS